MAYATQTDLVNLGLPAAALGTLTAQQITQGLQSASDFADTFFRARWGQTAVPLASWDSTVTEAVARIAAVRLLRIRGYSPKSSADQQFQQGYEDAVDWLNKVQRQQAHPLVVLAGGATAPIAPLLISTSVINLASGARNGNRGW